MLFTHMIISSEFIDKNMKEILKFIKMRKMIFSLTIGSEIGKMLKLLNWDGKNDNPVWLKIFVVMEVLVILVHSSKVISLLFIYLLRDVHSEGIHQSLVGSMLWILGIILGLNI